MSLGVIVDVDISISAEEKTGISTAMVAGVREDARLPAAGSFRNYREQGGVAKKGKALEKKHLLHCHQIPFQA